MDSAPSASAAPEHAGPAHPGMAVIPRPSAAEDGSLVVTPVREMGSICVITGSPKAPRKDVLSRDCQYYELMRHDTSEPCRVSHRGAGAGTIYCVKKRADLPGNGSGHGVQGHYSRGR